MLVLLSSLAHAADSNTGGAPTSAAKAATWRLEDLYPTLEAFEAGRADVEAKIAELPKCRGRLGESAVTLLECLEAEFAVGQALGRLSSYTSNHSAAGEMRRLSSVAFVIRS